MDTRQEWIDGLSDLADFVESHPDFPLPDRHGTRVYVWAQHDSDGEGQLAFLGRCARVLGRATKEADEKYFTVARKFGPHVLAVCAHRDAVCERVVVGTETVEVQVPPPGVEMLAVTEVREVVEWHCPESLLAAAVEPELAGS